MGALALTVLGYSRITYYKWIIARPFLMGAQRGLCISQIEIRNSPGP